MEEPVHALVIGCLGRVQTVPHAVLHLTLRGVPVFRLLGLNVDVRLGETVEGPSSLLGRAVPPRRSLLEARIKNAAPAILLADLVAVVADHRWP